LRANWVVPRPRFTGTCPVVAARSMRWLPDMSDFLQSPMQPEDNKLLGNDLDRPADEHQQDDEDWLLIDPNFLAQFRRPMTEAELDEAARKLEQAIKEWLEETEDSSGLE
jgi:hypothetical protein